MKYSIQKRALLICSLVLLNPLLYSMDDLQVSNHREREVKEFFFHLARLPSDIRHYVALLVLGNSFAFNFEPLRRFLGHKGPISSVRFSPDGESILTGSDDCSACLWDMRSSKLLQTLVGHTAALFSVDFSPDGKRALTVSNDATVRLWDTSSGKEVEEFYGGYLDATYSAVFSPDGTMILIYSRDGMFYICDAGVGKGLRAFRDSEGPIFSAAFSPDGKKILTGSSYSTARLWEVASGKRLLQLPCDEDHPGIVCSVAFNHEGQQALTGLYSGVLHLWDAESGKFIRKFERHESLVFSVVWSLDGKMILSSSFDGARLWDSNSGECLKILKGHNGPVSSAVFSPDGKAILTGSYDWTACLWEVVPCNSEGIGPLASWLIARFSSVRRNIREVKSISVDELSLEHDILSVLPEHIQAYIKKWYSIVIINRDKLKRFRSIAAEGAKRVKHFKAL